MQYRNKCVLLAVLVLGSLLAEAQNIRLAGVDYVNYPSVQEKEGGGDFKSAFQEFGAFAYYPTVLKNKKTILMNGFRYGYVGASFSNDASANEVSHQFHAIAYSLMVIHRWTDRWTFIGMLTPTLASDFKDPVSGDDFLMQGVAAVNKKINDHLTLGGGIAYTTRLGKPLWLPTVQVHYTQDRHHLQFFLPSLNYFYEVGDKRKLNIGFRAMINGATFNTSSDVANTGVEIDRLNYSRANLGPVVNYKLTKLLQVEAFGGLSGLRKYRLQDIQGMEHKYDAQHGSFFTVGISLVPPFGRSDAAGVE